MTDTVTTPEEKRIQEVAQTYRDRGFEVVVEPRRDQLPEFLARFRPDLLARKGDASVVVEVKSRSSLARADDLLGLAQAVRAQPGWTLDVIVTNPQALSAEEAARTLSEEDIRRTLSEVSELIREDHAEAALLLAWTAAEATLRRLVLGEGLELGQRGPLYLLKQSATNALISQSDYRTLVNAMESRNSVAHGFRLPERGRYAEAVGQLLELTERLLEPNTVS